MEKVYAGPLPRENDVIMSGVYAGPEYFNNQLRVGFGQPNTPINPAGKICPKCKGESAMTAKFCMNCGERFTALRCKCGAEITGSFCTECGMPRNKIAPQYPDNRTIDA